MRLSLSTRQVGWTLLALTAVAVALTFTMVQQSSHVMDPTHLAPAAILVTVTIAWPFANGWRPFGSRALKTCAACGVQWRPAEEGTHSCPACEAGGAETA